MFTDKVPLYDFPLSQKHIDHATTPDRAIIELIRQEAKPTIAGVATSLVKRGLQTLGLSGKPENETKDYDKSYLWARLRVASLREGLDILKTITPPKELPVNEAININEKSTAANKMEEAHHAIDLICNQWHIVPNEPKPYQRFCDELLVCTRTTAEGIVAGSTLDVASKLALPPDFTDRRIDLSIAAFISECMHNLQDGNIPTISYVEQAKRFRGCLEKPLASQLPRNAPAVSGKDYFTKFAQTLERMGIEKHPNNKEGQRPFNQAAARIMSITTARNMVDRALIGFRMAGEIAKLA